MTYVPRAFHVEELSARQDLITDNNFGMLTVAGAEGLQVSHLPFLLDRDRGTFGHLRCHVAKANPIWREIEAAKLLAVFSGPHAYISPDWYANPDLVPTWNYTAAYVHGQARQMTDDELDTLLADLTVAEESRITNKTAWSVDAVPAETYEQMHRAIVGLDIAITAIDGKAKMSQNRGADDRAGVVEALQGLGTPDARAVAGLIETYNR
ncbi:MAG: FMN-binding negative transcriptional regulator [Proteobacteria bacterium]|nr:FMN-binding negative transcriptional regulator [Pseudomonadota bacterium]